MFWKVFLTQGGKEEVTKVAVVKIAENQCSVHIYLHRPFIHESHFIKDCLPYLFHGFINKYFYKISLDNMLYLQNKLYKF